MSEKDENKVPEDLFKNVTFYIVGDITANVIELLTKYGGKRDTYLSEMVSHVIADDIDHNEYQEARELFELPCVMSEWVLYSVKCGRMLDKDIFAPEGRLFSGVVACASKLAEKDWLNLWGMIVVNGGRCQGNLTSRCTHLLTVDMEGAKYTEALKHEHIKVVTPDWVCHSVEKNEKQEEEIYHPRLVVYPKPPSPPTPEPMEVAAPPVSDSAPLQQVPPGGVERHLSTEEAPPGSRPGTPGSASTKEALAKLVNNRMQDPVPRPPQMVAQGPYPPMHGHHPGLRTSMHPGHPPGPHGYPPSQHPGQHMGQHPGFHPGQPRPGQHPGYHPGHLQGQHPGQHAGHMTGHHPGQPHPQTSQAGQHPRHPGHLQGHHPRQPGQMPGQHQSLHPGQHPGYMQARLTGQHPIQQGHMGQHQGQHPGQQVRHQGPQGLHPGQQSPGQQGHLPQQPGHHPGQHSPHHKQQVHHPGQQSPHAGQPGHHPSQQGLHPGQHPGQPGQHPGQQVHHPGQQGHVQGHHPGQPGHLPGQPGHHPGQPSQHPSQQGHHPGQPGQGHHPMQQSHHPGQQGQGHHPGQPLHHPGQPGHPSGQQPVPQPQGPQRAPLQGLTSPQQQPPTGQQKLRNITNIENQKQQQQQQAQQGKQQQQQQKIGYPGGASPMQRPPPPQYYNQQSPTGFPGSQQTWPLYWGHDPADSVPADMCLLGCIFYINDYPKIVGLEEVAKWKKVIEQHGGQVDPSYSNRVTHVMCASQKTDVFLLALRDQRRIVTAFWLNDVLAKKKMLPPWQALHLPLLYSDENNKPCSNQIISITNFEGGDRDRVKQMIHMLGAQYTGYMTRTNSALVCRSPEGVKYQKAKEWQIPVMNVEWLSDLLLGHMDALKLPIDMKYLQINKGDEFQMDLNKVQPLMAAWRTPLKVTKDTWKRFSPNIKKNLPAPGQENVPNKKARLDPSSMHPIPDLNAPGPRVLFTGFIRADTKQLQTMVTQLGGSVVENPLFCTHLVAAAFSRTMKFFVAINVCQHIVTRQWVEQSNQRNAFLDEKMFPLQDAAGEAEIKCSLQQSLARSRAQKLFAGMTFFVTPSVKPPVAELKKIIESAGGTLAKKKRLAAKTISSLQDDQGRPTYIVITCQDDIHLCDDLIEKKIKVFTAEFILTGVLRQERNFQQFQIEIQR